MWNWKLKRMVASALVGLMLFSNQGMAMAAESANIQPVTVNAESELTLVKDDEKIGYATDDTDGAIDGGDDNEARIATGSNAVRPDDDEEEFEAMVGVWSDKAPLDGETEEDEVVSSPFRAARMAAARSVCPSYAEVYEILIGLQSEYPEGMKWTNYEPYGADGELGPYYRFRGGKVLNGSLGVGCAAYVFLFSDEAFGDLPARTTLKGGFKYEDIKVGDILRMNDSHFVIVLRVGSSGVMVTEANSNSSVHWGRSISKAEVMSATNFVVTRYPVGYSEEEDADEVFVDGQEGNLTWTLTNGGTLTISGSGAMPNYTESKRPSWEEYNGQIGNVVIEDGVTSVGNYAFYESQAMDVYIPETATNIGTAAFKQSSLVAVTVPGSVKTVGDEAFYNCESLKSATFEDGVQKVGDKAFSTCGIEYLDFPNTLTSMGAGAFMDCQSLHRVRFASGDQTVQLGENMFSGCWYLYDVTLPLKAYNIPGGMFSSCLYLTYLYIPSGINYVEGVGTASGSPFANCKRLTAIDFGGTEAQWKAKGGPSALQYAGLSSQVKVNCNVAFDDPFAVDPNDPGDMVICTHVDEDNNDLCDECGEVMPGGENPEPEEPEHEQEDCPNKDSLKPGETCPICGLEGEDPDETKPCEKHVDEDGDGLCDMCSKEMPKEPDEIEKPGTGETNPDDGDKPGTGETDPDTGDPITPPVNPGEGDGDEKDPTTPTQPGGGEEDPEKPGGGEDEKDPVKPGESETGSTRPGTDDTDKPGTGDSGSGNTGSGDGNKPGTGSDDKNPTRPATPSDATPPDDSGSENDGSGDNETGAGNDGSDETPKPDRPDKPGVGGSDTNDPGNSDVNDSNGSDNTGTGSGSGGSGNGTGSGAGTGNGSSGTGSGSGNSSGSGTVSRPKRTRRSSSGGLRTTTTIRTTETGTVTTTVNADGTTQIGVRLTAETVNAAQQGGVATLPIAAVQAAKDVATAPAITVQTGSENSTRVAIPVVAPTAGMVAVKVNPDGTTEVIKASVVTEGDIVAWLSDGATVKIVDYTMSFADVPVEMWFAESVNFVAARGLIDPAAEGWFAPETPVNYATLIEALARFENVDMSTGAWPGVMAWAQSRGLVDESNGELTMTYHDLLAVLWRYAGSPGWAEGAQAEDWAAKNGIEVSATDLVFDPQGQATRAQAAQAVMNLVKLLVLGSGQ